MTTPDSTENLPPIGGFNNALRIASIASRVYLESLFLALLWSFCASGVYPATSPVFVSASGRAAWWVVALLAISVVVLLVRLFLSSRSTGGLSPVYRSPIARCAEIVATAAIASFLVSWHVEHVIAFLTLRLFSIIFQRIVRRSSVRVSKGSWGIISCMAAAVAVTLIVGAVRGIDMGLAATIAGILALVFASAVILGALFVLALKFASLRLGADPEH